MAMTVEAFFDRRTFTASFVVIDPEKKACAIIDPVLDFDLNSGRTWTKSADNIVNFVTDSGLTVEWILETHLHADHLTAAPYLQQKLGGKTGIGSNISASQKTFAALFNAEPSFAADGSQFDHLFQDEERVPLGSAEIQAWHTPGHTPACTSYLIDGMIFVGDTIFMPDFGSARCDFPGGSAAQLYQSIRRILALPAATRIFVGHDYGPGGRDFAWETTVGEQRANNKHIHDGISMEDFVSTREGRDRELDVPGLLLPAVQVNMRAGHMPPAEANGTAYLKLPLNKI